MIQTKYFSWEDGSGRIDDQINAWIKKNTSKIEIIDIKLDSWNEGTGALVIYDDMTLDPPPQAWDHAFD